MKEEKFIVDMGGFKTTIEVKHIVLSDDDPEVRDWELNPIKDYWVCEVTYRQSWEGYEPSSPERELREWCEWWDGSQLRCGTKRQYEIIAMKRPNVKAIVLNNSHWLMDMKEDHSTKEGVVYEYGWEDYLTQPFLEKDQKELHDLIAKCGSVRTF